MAGTPHAWARRLGVQEIIWNRQIWSSGNRRRAEGMRPYTGQNPHTDHVHIGVNWSGARKQSSYWRGCGGTLPQPAPGAQPGGAGAVQHGLHEGHRYVVYPSEVRVDGTRAWRNNNPGNIVAGEFTRRAGAIGSDGRFAIFPDEVTGMRAIAGLLRTDRYASLTLADAFVRYAPPNENDTAAYVASVVRQTGIAADRVMNTLTDAELDAVAQAIRRVEGWRAGETFTCSNGPEWARSLLGCR